MSEKATPQQADEVFAFELAYWFHLNTNDPTTAGKDREGFTNHWRDNEDYRLKARTRAAALRQYMEEAGLRPQHVANSKQVVRSLEAMVTMPARPAYELPGEDAPFDQSGEDPGGSAASAALGAAVSAPDGK